MASQGFRGKARGGIGIGQPFGDLYVLAARIENRTMSESAAVRLVQEGSLPIWPPGALDECMEEALALVHSAPELAYYWSRLILALSEIVCEPGRRSEWWVAAAGFVEITRRSLYAKPWGGRLLEALRVADLQAEVLERRITELTRYSSLAGGRAAATATARKELTEARVAAAWVLAGPYCSALDPDDIRGSFQRWSNPFHLDIGMTFGVFPAEETEEIEEVQADTERWSFNPNEALPPPQYLLEQALARLDLALHDAPPALRGLCQVKRACILPLLARLDPEREGEYWEAARAVVHEVWWTSDQSLPLADFFQAVAPVAHRLGIGKPTRLKTLLRIPLSQLSRQMPGPALLRLLANVLVFVEDARDLRDIWTVILTILKENAGLPGVPTWVWRDLAHHLPGNQLRCPPHPVPLSDLTASVEKLCRRKRPPSTERAATLVHATMHVLNEDLADAVNLLHSIYEVNEPFRDAHAWMLSRLAGFHRQQYAVWLRGQGRHQEALLEYVNVAEGLVPFAARHHAPGLLTQLANDALTAAKQSECEDVDALMLIKIVDPVVSALISPGDDHSSVVRELGQEVARLVHDSRVPELYTAHHLLFKGYAFRLLMEQPGPRPPTEWVQLLNQLIAMAESEAGPYAPDRGKDNTAAPLGLMFLNSAEFTAEPGAEESPGHLRQVADLSISTDLIHGPHQPKYEEMDRPDPLQATALMRNALDDETVVISLYLAERLRDSRGESVDAAQLLSCHVTSETQEIVAASLKVPTGLLRAIDHERNIIHSFSFAVFPIARIREEVNADPGASPVTLYGADLLERHFGLSGLTVEQLDRWRAAGKRHLCFWPHGPLHYLPLHLLHADGRPLADDWIVTTVANSVQYLPRRTGAADRRHRLLIAGSAAGGSRYGLRKQPEIETHVNDLTVQIPHARKLKSGATTPHALMEAVTEVDYLHVAAHGSHDAEAPWYQCLYLDPDDSGEGRLFAHQILSLDLRGVDLVTLSACESALGRYDLNDNLRGLPAAFILAGASTVIGVLWPVTAPVATLFYEELYLSLLADSTKRDAFRQAQQATRAAFPQYRDWGAFTLIGDWQ
ncbi:MULTISPECIES: CHAT domain-containing protein [unclassified Streptomyces]|uniref:CHAT domain-containing protein n=1 Tax=unclassified Streptomyces TaxID=2593676 RepID=UPI00371F5602